MGTSVVPLAYSCSECALLDGGNLLRYRRRIILWIVYLVGLVSLAVWASWRHRQQVAHLIQDSRCRPLSGLSHYVEPEIQGPDAVGERADRNDVYAGFGYLADAG